MNDLERRKRSARRCARRHLERLRPVRDEISDAVVAHLKTSAEWGRSSVVMAYLATPTEVDLDGLWSGDAGPTVCAPRVDWDTGTMRPVPVADPEADTVIRRHGVREPRADLPAIDPRRVDLVLVPGLAFDASGGRLGRGGGFYDRFLPGAGGAGGPDGAVRIGVCWSGQIVDAVPAEPHDVRVHMLVTEDGLSRCAAGDP